MIGRGDGSDAGRRCRWAVKQGYGTGEDLARIEEYGCMASADPEAVSKRAKCRQRDEMGTLGSGNHYLEAQGRFGGFRPLQQRPWWLRRARRAAFA